jgi:hypothetical protein
MTLETRATIELQDIAAIEVECSKCHTKTAYQIASFNPPIRCSACADHDRQQWLIPGSGEMEDLKRLAEIIRCYGVSTKLPFGLRLELTPKAMQSISASREGA